MLDVKKLEIETSRLSEREQRDFKIFISEAHFFHEILLTDLSQLKSGSRVIEVGSGIGLLSLLIGSLGLHVDSYEPASSGFGNMAKFRALVLRCWDGPTNVSWFESALPREFDSSTPRADYLVAVHVLEHVPQPLQLILSSMSWTKFDGQARFILPNYAFPYEPHFGFPTLGRKSWTYRLWRRKIEASSISDAQEFWEELSWPTLHHIRNGLNSQGVDAEFSREVSQRYTDRLVADEVFRRRMRVSRTVAVHFSRLLRQLIGMLPVSIVPIIDLRIRHRSDVLA
jgi:2-polyprenyl-3-methyl-5-hydroxy-6-metoxy-1,4-benzoquinol methylase